MCVFFLILHAVTQTVLIANNNRRNSVEYRVCICVCPAIVQIDDAALPHHKYYTLQFWLLILNEPTNNGQGATR